jgi:TolA-binding protein
VQDLKRKKLIAAAVIGLVIFTLGFATARWLEEKRRNAGSEEMKKQILQLETAVEEARIKAAESASRTVELEKEIETLRTKANEEDKKLQNLAGDTGIYRDRYRLSKRKRANDTTGEELCRRLEELGHPCK